MLPFSKSTAFLKWQAILIVLPALVLSLIGFYSLRQDRILSEHKARETAENAARQLLDSILPNALRIEPTPIERVTSMQRGVFSAAADPIDQYGRRSDSTIAFLVDSRGELVYPPAVQEVLDPAPIASQLFNNAQTTLWTEMQGLSNSAPEKVIDLCTRFLATEPPMAAAAIAQYQLAVLLERKGDLGSAQPLFESLLKRFPGAVSESGIALAPLAEWHLLRLPLDPVRTDTQRQRWIDGIGSWAVLHPSVFSARFVERLAAEGGSAAMWQRVLEGHDRARQAYQKWKAGNTNERFIG